MSHTNTYTVGLSWTTDRSVLRSPPEHHTTFRRDTYLCPPVWFEPAISASEQPHTYDLDCPATEIGCLKQLKSIQDSIK